MSKDAVHQRSRRFLSVFFKFLLPLIITVGLCYVLFAKQDVSEMIRIALQECNYWWIALALGLSVVSHVVRAMRWQLQLRAINVNAPLFTVVLSIFGTYAVNLLFPRLGELWRTGYIAQREDAPFDAVFGSMVADRLADTITVALLMLSTLLLAGGPLMDFLRENGAQSTLDGLVAIATSPMVWAVIVVLVMVAIVALMRFKTAPIVVKILDFFKGIWRGFAAITTMKGRGRWLLLTVCIWGCYFLQLYVAFFAFPATAKVVADYGIGAVAVCFLLSSIAMVIPSNGGIGPWQIAVMFGLSIYASGIPELTSNYAASFANLVLGSQALLLVLLGIFTFISIAIQKRKDV